MQVLTIGNVYSQFYLETGKEKFLTLFLSKTDYEQYGTFKLS